MSEFFLSTDFGILLCVFFFGVGISGRLAAWVRAIHAGLVSLRKRTVRHRVNFLERELKHQYNIGLDHEDRLLSLESVKANRDTDLEDRIKLMEDWLVTDDSDKLYEFVDKIKKKAKEREAAYKKID